MSDHPYRTLLDPLSHWEAAVRNHGDREFRISPETVLSLPVPLAQEDKTLSLIYFVYRGSLLSDLRTRMNFPYQLLSIDYPGLKRVETFQVPPEWDDLRAVFPVIRPLQNNDPQKERMLRMQFSDLYEGVVELFPQGNPQLIASRFLELFAHFNPTVIQTLYEQLNPLFWHWLRAGSTQSQQPQSHS